uniref:Uncharacterized protein n=1 Tax=Anguilla anguilla TaxID=7936 RepID=A0A0E9SDD2_ANGAN
MFFNFSQIHYFFFLSYSLKRANRKR